MFLAKTSQGSAYLRHLHQRVDSFLHTGTARRGNDDNRALLLDADLNDTSEFFSDDGTHASAEEAELEYSQTDRNVQNSGPSGKNCIQTARVFLRALKPLFVLLAILKIKRVRGLQGGVDLLEGMPIREQGDALTRREAEMMVTLTADAKGAPEIFSVQHDPAARALGPDVVRKLKFIPLFADFDCCRLRSFAA